MDLSASLYSKSEGYTIKDTVSVLDQYGVAYFHIDCNDNLEVFNDIYEINAISDTPIDLHIISEDSNKFIEGINSHSIDRVSFQIENISTDIPLDKITACNKGIAIQIHNENATSEIKKYNDKIDFVLLMMTTPGISGGKFEKTFFKRIRSIVSEFPEMKFCIDGGVNNEVAYILRLIGIDSIVVGSYLLNNRSIAQSILNINKRKVKSNFQIKDYMIPIGHLPIIDIKSTLYEAIQKIEKFNLGTVFCIDEDKALRGIITNADVRKVILRREFDYKMSLDTVINKNPKIIYQDDTTKDMIAFIDSVNFPILVLPVLGKDNKLKGAISFHNILKEDF